MLINIILVIPWSGCMQENCPLGTQAMNDLMVINVGGRSWQACDMYDIYEVMRGGTGESKLGVKSCWELNNQVVEDIASSLHAIWLWCIAVFGVEDHWSSSFPATSLDDRPQLWKGIGAGFMEMVIGYVLSLPFDPFQRHTENVTIFHTILVPSHEWVTLRFDMVCSLDGNMVESVVFKPVLVLYSIYYFT